MKKLFSALFCVLLTSSLSVLQGQDTIVKSYKNAFTFNISRVLLLEGRLGYERNISSRNIIRVTIGYKFPVSTQYYEPLNSFFATPIYLKVNKGPYVSLGYSFMIIPKANFYISPEVYYQYNYFDNKYYKLCVGSISNSEISLRSRSLEKSGIKILVGKKVCLNPHAKFRVLFDFFVGYGLQYWNEEQTIFAKTQGTCSINALDENHYYDPPRKEINYRWQTTFHGGVLLSTAF